MNIEGLENITLEDLNNLFKINVFSVEESMHTIRAFRNKYGLDENQGLKALNIARRIFDK